MYKEFEVLFKKYNIVKCDLVTKGFSKDKKYIIEDNKNTKYILPTESFPLILSETEPTTFCPNFVCTLGNCSTIRAATCNDTSSTIKATSIFRNFLINYLF